MNKSNPASPMGAQEKLEDCWRSKVEDAHERYRVATTRYSKLLEESNGLMPAVDGALFLARHEQSAALLDYQRILRIFTDLTAAGRIPEEELTASTNGAK